MMTLSLSHRVSHIIDFSMFASKSKKTAETPSSSVLNTSSSDNQESALDIVAGAEVSSKSNSYEKRLIISAFSKTIRK